MSNRVSINGRTIEVPNGRNLSIINNKVYVDGKLYDTDKEFPETKVFNIVIEGNVEKVENEEGSITVNGSAGSISAVNGNVSVGGSVSGSVSSVNGDMRISGTVGGSVSTVNGDIKQKK